MNDATGKSSANGIKRGRIANEDNCHFPVAHSIRSLVISLEDNLPPLTVTELRSVIVSGFGAVRPMYGDGGRVG